MENNGNRWKPIENMQSQSITPAFFGTNTIDKAKFTKAVWAHDGPGFARYQVGTTSRMSDVWEIWPVGGLMIFGTEMSITTC